ncbi:MAG: ABC transporter ATP-binding protein [Clostridiales bacterium]|jgi:putative ABC transport system ATP-binding protein|nr:ABC transporter ATP-binding protein [Clostridiales bacterium]
MQPVLKIESLKKYYGKGDSQTKALDGISFQVMPGEFLGIMGASGSGKSTLLNCIAAVIKPTSGSIEMNGKEISKLSGSHLAEYRGKDMGYIFQSFELIDNLTGKENILLPVSLHGGKEDADSERFRKITEYLEIKDILNKFPSQMSGGEKQRIAAARALILNPGMILCDEPTGALDSKNAKALMTKLSGLNSEDGSTILMVTHDSNAASFCNRIMFIQDGKLFHELRKEDNESRESFYDRILKVLAQLGGGSANVL